MRGKQASAVRFDSAGLMNGGMRVRRAERPFELLGERGDGKDVRRRATRYEAHVGIRLRDLCPDIVRRLGTMLVRAVAYRLLEVRAHKGIEDVRMGAFAVIVAKLVHVGLLGLCVRSAYYNGWPNNTGTCRALAKKRHVSGIQRHT